MLINFCNCGIYVCCICLSVYLSICLSVSFRPSARPLFCRSVCLSVFLSLSLSFCQSIHPHIYIYIYIYIYICVCVCMCVCVSVVWVCVCVYHNWNLTGRWFQGCWILCRRTIFKFLFWTQVAGVSPDREWLKNNFLFLESDERVPQYYDQFPYSTICFVLFQTWEDWVGVRKQYKAGTPVLVQLPPTWGRE